LGGSKYDDVLAGVRTAGGGVLSAGWTESRTGNKRTGWLVRTDDTGKLVWQRAVGSIGDTRELAAVARISKGHFVAAGWTREKVGPRSWLVRLDGGGEVLWERHAATLGYDRGLMVDPGGAVLAVGAQAEASKKTSAVLRYADPLGNPQWQRTVNLSDADLAIDALGLADGGIAAVGERLDGGLRRGLLLRADAWGQTACKSSGICGKKNRTGCDDGNVCTADSCDPTKGCQHVAAAGFACDPADGCHTSGLCVSGACKPGKQARLFSRTHQLHKELFHVGAVAALPGGDIGVAGTATKRTWVVSRLSATGGLRWTRTFIPTVNFGLKDDALPGAVVLRGRPDGSVIVFGDAATKGDLSFLQLRKLDRDGEPVWAWKPTDKHTQGDAAELLLDPDGKHITLMVAAFGRVRRLQETANGAKSLWVVGLKGTMNKSGTPRGVTLPDGSVVIGLAVAKTNGSKPQTDYLQVARVGAAGTIAWKTLVQAPFGLPLTGAVRRDKTTILGGSYPHPVGFGVPWLRAFDDSGKLVWQRDGNRRRKVGAMAAWAGGFAFAGATKSSSGGAAVFVQRRGAFGARLGVRQLANGSAATWLASRRGLVETADGDLLVGGITTVGSGKHLWLARVDRWGNTDCAASGGCGGKTTADCDDGNPCTADRCAQGKCSNSASSAMEGLPCAPGGVCALGKCTPIEQGMCSCPPARSRAAATPSSTASARPTRNPRG